MCWNSLKTKRIRIWKSPTYSRNNLNLIILEKLPNHLFPVVIPQKSRCRKIKIHRPVRSKNTLKFPKNIQVFFWLVPNSFKLIIINKEMYSRPFPISLKG